MICLGIGVMVVLLVWLDMDTKRARNNRVLDYFDSPEWKRLVDREK